VVQLWRFTDHAAGKRNTFGTRYVLARPVKYSKFREFSHRLI
jgi:hypothetical protein